jgi:hypothetical protein
MNTPGMWEEHVVSSNMVYVAPHQKAVAVLQAEIDKRKYEIEELEKAIKSLQLSLTTSTVTGVNTPYTLTVANSQ